MKKDKVMYVSVIVPTYNDWTRLALCIDALVKQTYPADLFEVIIVNNNPSDEIPAAFVIPTNFQIIREPKPGSYAARNTALKLAKGEILAFTDSDCVPDKNWLQNAVAYFISHPDCSRIGGNVLLFPKGSKASVAEKYDSLYYFQQREHVKYFGTSVTANMFSRRDVFAAMGPFDENKMSCGDIDWGKAAHNAGFRMDFVENVIVNHPARDLKDLIKKERRLTGGLQNGNVHKNVPQVFWKFLKGIRPRLGEYRAIRRKGSYLSSKEAVSILFLRYLLQYVRNYEQLKLELGKRPNRE